MTITAAQSLRALYILMLATGTLASGGFDRAAEPGPGPCVDVQVGDQHTPDLDCINQNLRKFSAREQSGAQLAPPMAAGSSSVESGTVNQAAAQQMMGNAFGKSAAAQRPHPTYISPLPGVPASH